MNNAVASRARPRCSRAWLWYVPALAALGVAATLLNSPAVSATPVNLVPERPVVWKDFLGVNAHFLWFTPEQYQQQMSALKQLGLEWVRVDLHWDHMEPTQGAFNFGVMDQLDQALGAAKLKSVFYLVGSAPFSTSAPAGAQYQDQYPPKDPALFARRMADLATRYPNVNAWQIWNEPNIPSYWRPDVSPEGYGRLLLASSQALTQAAPGKTQVMAGMAFYSQMPPRGQELMLTKLAELGAQSLGTVIAYHPYSLLPESDTAGMNEVLLRGNQLNASLRAAGVKDIWATEWGWSSYSGPQEMQPIIGVDGQADYTLRRLALMSTQDYQRIFLFALSDLDSRATVRDQSYGLLDLKGQPKPVYLALSRFLRITGPRLDPGTTPALAKTPNTLYSVAWTRADGKHLWMFWSAEGRSLKLPSVNRAELHDPLTGQQQTLQASDGVEAPLKPTLQILVW